jgi:MYXO-CTERM domain-containing protein
MASGTVISNMVGGTQTSNTWTLSVTANTMDFMSAMESEAGSPRQADGSLPNVPFMKLVSGSDLIDKGENVGLPFTGTAPDLGAFEFGATAGTGGMGGSGGTGMAGMAGRAMGGASGTGTGAGAGGAPGGAAGTGAGGMQGGAAGASVGGTAGDAGASAGGVGTGGTGTATGGTGPATGGTGTATGGVGVGGATSGTGTGATAPTGGSSTAGAGTGDAAEETADPAGCGCRVGANHATWPAALLLLLAFSALSRRRSRR